MTGKKQCFNIKDMKVPFNDLQRHHLDIKDEIDAAIDRVINCSSFIRGEDVDRFEEEFSNLFNVKHTVSCANGTDAITIAAKALDIKKGDEVIVPANSWISSSAAITQAGGTPIFCDVNEYTYCIDVEKIEDKITCNTVGILPVHLFGHPAEMPTIMKIAEKHKLWVIEDCAQGHLGSIDGKLVGTFGNAATFSFYPGKNLGAMGDAGAVVTNDDAMAIKMAMFARHGGLTKGDHKIEGINSRLDGLQAAILRVKLKYLKIWTDKRIFAANRYFEHLKDVNEIICPNILERYKHVFHLFVIRTDHRNELREYLSKRDIQTVINYPIALPLLPAYARYNYSKKDFPVASDFQDKILSLPIFPEIEELQIKHVVDSIQSFYSRQ